MTDLHIEQVDPTTLTPAPYNPRTMSAEARARLRTGIEQFGLVDPLIVRRVDRLIVGGHQRHAVALDMGLTTVPVVFLDDLDDQRAAALNILLNNPNAQGVWDYPRLTSLLSDLDAHGFDARLTGFDDLAPFLSSHDGWATDLQTRGEMIGADGDARGRLIVECPLADLEAVKALVGAAIDGRDGVAMR